MKKIFVLGTIFLGLVACGGTEKKLSTDQVLDSITKSVCQKMAECNKMPNADACQSVMKTALSGVGEKKPDLSTSEKSLNACVAAIEKATCDDMQAKEPPKDCAFMNKTAAAEE